LLKFDSKTVMRKPCDIVAPACHVRVLQVLV
jgi:hypothetical protein